MPRTIILKILESGNLLTKFWFVSKGECIYGIPTQQSANVGGELVMLSLILEAVLSGSLTPCADAVFNTNSL